jgi:hypothetical protein
MKSIPNRVLLGMLVLLLGAGHLSRARADDSTPPGGHELVIIENVPLTDAIRNLTRQMELNYILDPHVPGVAFGPGRRVKQPIISRRWTNATPEQVLRAILRENQLILVTNLATTIARIAPGSVAVWPVNPGVAGMEGDTNQPVPLIVIEDVPLLDVFKNTCRHVGRTAIFDPDVSEAFAEGCEIQVRWENLTARQALGALLDNYGLMMREDPSTGMARIRFKNRQQAAIGWKESGWFR